MNLFQVIKISENTYQSVTLWNPLPNLPVYGGQLISQALQASYDTTANFRLHSLHCYFLHPGNMKSEINYCVTVIKDGRSFFIRKIDAIQNNKTIFTMNASFCKIEETNVGYQKKKPKVSHLEFINLNDMLLKTQSQELNEIIKNNLKVLYENFDIYVALENRIRYFRFSFKKKVNNTRDLSCFIAFISDFLLIEAGLIILGVDLISVRVKVIASVDHSLHIHQDLDLDEDTYYLVAECDRIMGTSVCCKGFILNSKMDRIATIYQEGMIKLNE